ncbi:MAG: hypothetical protein ABT940_08600 [Alphaproteobacteria bacterium]
MGMHSRRGSHGRLVFLFEGVTSGATVGVELSRQLNGCFVMPRTTPMVQIDAFQPGSVLGVSSLIVKPQRIDVQLTGAPAVLRIMPMVECDEPFVYGHVQAPGEARITIQGALETLHLAGPGFWALPAWMPIESPPAVREVQDATALEGPATKARRLSRQVRYEPGIAAEAAQEEAGNESFSHLSTE